MNLSCETRWFAIQARPGSEGTAALRLHSLSIETLLPLARRPMRHARRSAQMMVRPLFPGYLFARFSAASSWRAVTYSHGVIRIVGTGTQPLAVDDSIIDNLRARLGVNGCVDLGEPPLVPGDGVRIASGPLCGWTGIFERDTSDEQRVVILIETLQQGRVVLARGSLERAEVA